MSAALGERAHGKAEGQMQQSRMITPHMPAAVRLVLSPRIPP